MKESIYKKYEDIEGLPKTISIIIRDESCEGIKFNNDYWKYYFIGGSANNLNPPHGLNKTCEWVEEEIYNVRDRIDWSANDILRILAWKTGKIDHKKCNENGGGEISYYANWIEGKTDDVIGSLQLPYQQIISGDNFMPIVNKVKELRRKWCKKEEKKKDEVALEIWSALLDLVNGNENNASRGLGTVPLLTILHFITGGEYPIFDRFAMASLSIWKLKKQKEDIKIVKGSVVHGCSLPGKGMKEVRNILERGIYHDYIELLNEFCKSNYGNKDEWKTNRNVDRALWVFGHFFQVE